MKRLSLLLASIALSWAPLAYGQVTVLGSGLGKDCYDAVKNSKKSLNSLENICTTALLHGNLSPSNRAATYVNRGIVKMRGGDYNAALSDYNAAERLQSSQGPIYLNRGAALVYMKQFADALPEFNRAIELDTPDLFAAYYNRAIAKERTGDVTGAYLDFKKSLELKPDFEQAKWQLERFIVTEN